MTYHYKSVYSTEISYLKIDLKMQSFNFLQKETDIRLFLLISVFHEE